MKNILYTILFIFFVISSCTNDINLIENTTDITEISTKSSSTEIDPFEQIADMSVNIIAPNYYGSKYLSANIHPDNWRIVGMKEKDEYTGYQQWLIKEISPVSGYKRYMLFLAGTMPEPYNHAKYLQCGGRNMASIAQFNNNSDLEFGLSFTFIKVNDSDNRYYISSFENTSNNNLNGFMLRRLFPMKANGYDIVNSNIDFLTNGVDSQWEIRPIESFNIEKIEYFMNPGDGDQILPMPDFITYSDITNNTSITQSMNAVFSEKATEQSKFSETKGMSVTIKAGATFGIPNISLGGSLEMTSVSSNSWSIENSETKEDSRTYTFPVIVPPYSKVKATASVLRYNVRVSYIATLKGQQSKKIIKLYGTWEGVRASTINYKLTEVKSNKIIKTFHGTPTNPIDLTKDLK